MNSTPEYIEVSAGVRYWEDATINGVKDEDGELIPLRDGDRWCPTIRLADGFVLDWPSGTEARIHYKVCDEGEYRLLNAERQAVAERLDGYVPDAFLCHGGRGCGSYIILDIGSDGYIKGWKRPEVDPDDWDFVEPDARYGDDPEVEALRAENAKLREVCIAIADAVDVTKTDASLRRVEALLGIRLDAAEVEFSAALRRLAGGVP